MVQRLRTRDLTDEVQMTNKHEKKTLRLTSIKDAIQFIRYDFTSIKLEKIKASD